MKRMEFDFCGRHIAIYNYHTVHIIDFQTPNEIPEIVHTYTLSDDSMFKAIMDL